MKLWEHYLLKGSAPEWSSTFQKVVLQIGAVPFRRYCSKLEHYLSGGSAPEWSSTVSKTSPPYKLCCTTLGGKLGSDVTFYLVGVFINF